MPALDLPNLISLSRYVGALAFLALCGLAVPQTWPMLPLVLLLVIYATDKADGVLARRYRDRDCTVGEVLDSATDSYTFIIVYIGLYSMGAVHLLTLASIVACRGLFDLVRFVGLSRRRGYPAPLWVTKWKGFVYNFASVVLYAEHAFDLQWLTDLRIGTAANVVVVVSTVVAATAFVSRHHEHVLAIIRVTKPDYANERMQ